MNLKKIEKASKIVEQIKRLDAAIIEIDRFALMIANQDSPCIIDLKADDEKKKAEESNKVRFDEDGSLLNPGHEDIMERMRRSMLGFAPGGWLTPSCGTPKDTRVSLVAEMSNTETLQVLGILLGNKQAQRGALLHQLQQIGVNI